MAALGLLLTSPATGQPAGPADPLPDQALASGPGHTDIPVANPRLTRRGPGARPGRRAAVASLIVAAVLVSSCLAVYAYSRTPPLTGLSAQVTSNGQVELDFPVAGVLSAINVSPGQVVRAGQVLATEAIPGLAGQVTVGRESVSADEATVAELERILAEAQAQGLASAVTVEADVANGQNQLAKDRAQLAAEQSQAAAERLVAPQAGRILSVNGAIGEVVSSTGVAASGYTGGSVAVRPGFQLFPSQQSSAGSSAMWSPVVVLAVGGPLLVNVVVPQSQIGLVRQGATVSITADVPGLPPVHGVVDEIFPSSVVAAGVVSYEVRVSVPATADARRYLTGMTATASIGH